MCMMCMIGLDVSCAVQLVRYICRRGRDALPLPAAPTRGLGRNVAFMLMDGRDEKAGGVVRGCGLSEASPKIFRGSEINSWHSFFFSHLASSSFYASFHRF